MTSFNASLGMKREQGAVVLDTRPEHEVGGGFIHFAVLATLAEVSAAEACGTAVVPASVALSLMSPARSGRLEARGRLLKRGKRLAVAEGEVTQAGQLVAKAVVTFAVL